MSTDEHLNQSKPEVDVKSLFSKTKKKIKPVTVQNLPPPPPPPPPKIDIGAVAASEEGWEREFSKLDSYLKERGLHIERVADDGSCLFASIALHFPSTTTNELRARAVNYMLTHPDDFEPFVDTEAYPNGFKDYCSRMLMPSTWGSQLELQALSQAMQVNVVIFQTGDKSRIDMVNFDENEAQCVTISYHDGQHYNGVLVQLVESAPGPILTYHDLDNKLDKAPCINCDSPTQKNTQSSRLKPKKKSLFN